MKPWVIKLGGAALSNPEAVVNLAQAIVLLKKEGKQVVVVHGGGPRINQRLAEKNIPWSFHEDQRITAPEMMGVIESALMEVNSMIVDILQKNDLNAVSVKHVNTALVEDALALGLIPVVAPIGIDADWAASSMAQSLEARILIYATDQRGILDLNELPYDSLTLDQLEILMEKGGVTGGMLAKSRSIKKALLGGVAKVCVTHAMELKDLIETKHGGTLCVEMSRAMYVAKVKENEYAISG